MAFPDFGPVPSGFRRAFVGVGSQVADGVSRLVGDAEGDRLEWVMRSPIRRAVLDVIFWHMPRELDRRGAPPDATVRWRITRPADDTVDVYDLIFAGGRCRVPHAPKGGGEPRVTVTVDGAEFVRLVTGNSDALQAYFKGRLTLAGDIMFAAKLVSMFRIPKGRRD